jgi:phenylalanyl-tRNA synthetase alpha chain
MGMEDHLVDLRTRFHHGLKEFQQEHGTKSKQDLLNFKAAFLGKEGEVTHHLKMLKNFSLEEKKIYGPQLQELKSELETSWETVFQDWEWREVNGRLQETAMDLYDRRRIRGHKPQGGYHPIHRIQREIEDIFLTMGFEVLDGPHIEDDHHNFSALNIPDDHPARDTQDTFWFEDKKHLLRTHTSTIQIRGMKERKPPFQFIGPGKVFRCERTDASHEMVFHQLEGMMVREDLHVGHLLYYMNILLKEIFQRDVDVRLRPGHFPFVEPGFELDIRCLLCQGKGCSVCKQVGWVELLPCGLVHPAVLKHGGHDPQKVKGFAFGLGLDRLVMMKYGINDIRLFHGSDGRFLEQFSHYVS